MTTTGRRTIPEAARAAFDETLAGLAEVGSLLKGEHVRRLLSQVDILADSPEGMELLLESMPRLLEAGVFRGTVWEDPERLVPALAGGTLRAGGETTLFEILSELRMLALAQGRLGRARPGRRGARDFLEQVLVHDLALAWPTGAEAEGDGGGGQVSDPALHRKLRNLLDLVTTEVPLDAMKGVLASELELLCAQRPVLTDRALALCGFAADRISLDPEREEDRRLLLFTNAVRAPSPEAARRTPAAYKAFLARAGAEALEAECRALARTMRETGLAVEYHALLVRRVAKEGGKEGAKEARLLPLALGLDAAGRAELSKHRHFVRSLIDVAIHPGTARGCYGLALLLERGLLSQQPVQSRLDRFTALELHPDVSRTLEEQAPDGLSARAFLLADCLGILGQPLGVGQGGNPTCQSARGISLWSRHAPGKLLGMIETAATTNDLSMRFEGQTIRAGEVVHEVTGGFDRNLDAVSIVLVPHLDRIYNEMMRRSSLRGDDPHRWVNPAMYGHWIPHGFLSAYDYATDSIRGYETFLRTFYATHHPAYNGGHDLAYPNPVGIFLTSASGALVGFHAVSVVRVAEKSGRVRVYFVNPNNEGRQHWQAEIRPTVAGNGERPGESSLPFHHFASRLYAFHFSPSEVGDLEQVDEAELDAVVAIAKESWGPSYRWTEEPGSRASYGVGG